MSAAKETSRVSRERSSSSHSVTFEEVALRSRQGLTRATKRPKLGFGVTKLSGETGAAEERRRSDYINISNSISSRR